MQSDPKPAYDRDSALAHLGGDEGLLAGLLALLRESGPGMRAAVEGALAAGDLDAAARAAHKLAGAVANLHAWPSRDAALAVERAAEAGNLPAAREAETQLRAEFDRLLESVAPSSPGDAAPGAP